MTIETITAFRTLLNAYYTQHGRQFPWRETKDPYNILVSEIMLQQTQTSRVMGKYESFIRAFPDFPSLADAPLAMVLSQWQGLGYNRRAVALQRIAQKVVASFDGLLPSEPEVLKTFPGIGPYTASAVATFAFNRDAVFVETNIRTVFLALFFDNRDMVRDRELLPLVEATLDKDNPRDWYYALFDFGVRLKQEANLNSQSAHYRKQSTFKGSDRELRGNILKMLLSQPLISEEELLRSLKCAPARLNRILRQMEKEGFTKTSGNDIALR